MKRTLLVSLLLGVLSIGGLYIDFIYSINRPLNIPEKKELDILRGAGILTITRQLTDNQLLSRPHWFAILAYWNGNAKKIKYGTYEFKSGLTIRSILDMLVAGNVKQYPVVLVEGWNMEQIRACLEQHTELLHTIGETLPEGIMRQVAPDCTEIACRKPEGWFFPSTYHVTKGTRDIDLLKRAYQKMQAVLASAWKQRSDPLPYTNPYQALTMASIVEKETAVTSERPAIAGVFIRRLLKGMRLQTDPTVIYGLGNQYTGDLRLRDLHTDTPYNTYTREGLPPTPIAMPGAESIQAALHPAAGNTLYFVARGDGTHQFSDTLEQHNAAVDLYQRHTHELR